MMAHQYKAEQTGFDLTFKIIYSEKLKQENEKDDFVFT